MENLSEIDEYPWHAGTHALRQTAHTFLLIFVGVSSPFLLHSVLGLILYHRVRIYLTARVQRPRSRLMQKHANTIIPNTHTQTGQGRGNRHPAHIKEVAKALWLVAGGCMQSTVILHPFQHAARTFLHSAEPSARHLQSAKHRNAAAHDNCSGLFFPSKLMQKQTA